jgi:hypothetical protein
MGRINSAFLSFNRGLISPKSLARVDLDRTRLSAEVMTNWIAKTQGAMTIRPGTKYFGSSLNDTGAEWIEFVASTDDVALLELTHEKMRVWLGDDAHALELLSRPPVDTTVSITDTGWSNASTGGAFATAAVDAIPTMTGQTTNGVKITASSENVAGIANGGYAWLAADDNIGTRWIDTGSFQGGTLPSWWNVNFDTGGGDTGARRAITSYSIRADRFADILDNAPKSWRLITANHDTGTFAIDTGKWTLEDQRSAQQDWAISEKRSYELPAADTGTIEARRHWRLYFTAVDTGAGDASGELIIGEIEMFATSSAQQVKLQGGRRILNASATGSMARAEKRLIEVA